jgi:hypothetical protein
VLDLGKKDEIRRFSGMNQKMLHVCDAAGGAHRSLILPSKKLRAMGLAQYLALLWYTSAGMS